MREAKEADIQRAILEYLRLLGVFCWRVNSGAITAQHNGKRRFLRFNGAAGCSDLVGLLPAHCSRPGVFLALEVKRPGRKPTEQQAAFLDAIRAAGGVAAVVSSLDDVVQLMRQVGVTPLTGTEDHHR